MKVMHILGNFGPGGAEMGVVRLIQSFSEDYFSHSVCSISSNISMKELLPDRINCYSLGINGASYTAFLSLFKLLKKTKTEIAHVNNLAPWFDVAFASRLAGCKCIETFHGIEDNLIKFSFKRRMFLRLASQYTSSITAVAESARDLLVELSGIKRHQIKVLPNGIDIDYYKANSSDDEKIKLRISLNLPENGFLIGCVAALRPVKDHKGLIEAFAMVISNKRPIGTNKGIYLILVGDGPLAPELKNLSKQLHVEDKIIFMGRRNDVNKILQALDAFILNSKTEGMSYAILEAMASGLPIVATNVGANAELISHGVEGYLYRPGDLKSLTGTMVELMRNENLLLKMGQKAREKVAKSYSITKMESSYKNLYEEVLSQRKIGRQGLGVTKIYF